MGKKTRDDKITALLRNYTCEKLEVDDKEYSKLDAGLRSRMLTRFYLEKIFTVLHKSMDEDDLDFGFDVIEEGLVDGKDDIGIDFITKIDDYVVIIQTKNSASITDEPVAKFRTILRRIANGQFKAHPALADLLKDINFKTDVFKLIFIGRGKYTDPALREIELGAELPEGFADLSDRVAYSWLDHSKLEHEWKKARSAEVDQPLDEFSFYAFGPRGKRTSIIELDTDNHRSAVFTTSAEYIYKLYETAGEALFQQNIRGYLGDTHTNSRIKDTMLLEPVNFFNYNNGISCICERLEIRPPRGEVVAHGLQVINGAQTVRSIHMAGGKADQERPRHQEAAVLVRITEIDQGYGKKGEFRENVIAFNNTQNIIKTSDFRSNDLVQKDVERKFKELKIKGTDHTALYLPKRYVVKKPRVIRIRMEDFIKVVYSFEFTPTPFAGKADYLFQLGDGGGYAKVFGDGEVVFDELPPELFLYYAGIWWMTTALQQTLKEKKANLRQLTKEHRGTDKGRDLQIEWQSLERKWLVIYAMKEVILNAYEGDTGKLHDVVRKFATRDFDLGVNNKGKWLQSIIKAAIKTVTTTYKNSVEDDPEFNHRNWTRSEKTVRKISNNAALIAIQPLDS